MFNQSDIKRDAYMLTGSFARKGYDWWWHDFTGISRKTGKLRPFFVEFFICNPALGGKDPVFGQLKENKENHIPPSYLMVKAGSWGEGKAQLHRFFGRNSVKVKKDVPYQIEAEDCLASETRLKGSISISKEEASAHPEWMCDGGSMSWDLQIEKKITFNVGYGAGSFFRAIKAFEMYWHAEGMKSYYKGTVTYNGEVYDVVPKSSNGYADKNWGRGFTSPWVWLSTWDLKSRISGKKLANSVFDIGGGRPKVFCFALDRKLLGVFYYEGKQYEFNFAKFWMGVKTRFECHETEDDVVWHVEQENYHALMITDVSCQKKDMLLVNYEAPDGSKRHNRLWNGGNGTGRVQLFEKTKSGNKLIDDIDCERIGCEYGEYDH